MYIFTKQEKSNGIKCGNIDVITRQHLPDIVCAATRTGDQGWSADHLQSLDRPTDRGFSVVAQLHQQIVALDAVHNRIMRDASSDVVKQGR
jgi:hypothetical protein